MPSGERAAGRPARTRRGRILAVAAAVTVMASGPLRPATAQPAAARVYAAQRVAMGTVFRILVHAPAMPPGDVRGAVEAALDEVARLDRILSHYDAESEASRLVRQPVGETIEVSASLYDALARALEMTRLTSGRFDVTVGPLVELWRAADGGDTPPPEALEAARRCVGSDKLTLVAPRGVRLAAPCMRLDFGAIGKGIAVDRATDVLRAHGITSASVNAGGSTIMAIGTAPGEAGWPVQAAGADQPVMLRDEALSTSEATTELIAIGAGQPETSRATVSVRAADATTADALSTALLLSPVDAGRAIVGHIGGASAWWTGPDGTVTAVAGPAQVALHGGPTR